MENLSEGLHSSMNEKKRLEPMKHSCSTCPFRDTGWTEVRELLQARALSTEGTPICHSTGPGALTKRVSKKAKACRGARDLQLRVFFVLGFIEADTDEAWDKKADELDL